MGVATRGFSSGLEYKFVNQGIVDCADVQIIDHGFCKNIIKTPQVKLKPLLNALSGSVHAIYTITFFIRKIVLPGGF